MVQGFPEKGARLVLLHEVGGVRAGSMCVLLRSIPAGSNATPEDVFVVEHHTERLWLLRRDLAPC
jgi:hypothetical protein